MNTFFLNEKWEWFSKPISVWRENKFENETKQRKLATSQNDSFFLLFITSDVVSWISTLNYPPNDPIKYFSFFSFDVMVVLCSFDVHLYTHTHTDTHNLTISLSEFFFILFLIFSNFPLVRSQVEPKNSFRFCCSVFSMS